MIPGFQWPISNRLTLPLEALTAPLEGKRDLHIMSPCAPMYNIYGNLQRAGLLSLQADSLHL